MHKRNGAQSIERLCNCLCPTLSSRCSWTSAQAKQLRNVMATSLWMTLYFLRNTGHRGVKKQEAQRTFDMFECWVRVALKQTSCRLPEAVLSVQLQELIRGAWAKSAQKIQTSGSSSILDPVSFLWAGSAVLRAVQQSVLCSADQRLLEKAMTEIIWEISVSMNVYARQAEQCSIGMMVATHQRGAKRPRRNWLLHQRLNNKKRRPAPCQEEQGEQPLRMVPGENISKGNFYYLHLGLKSFITRMSHGCVFDIGFVPDVANS